MTLTELLDTYSLEKSVLIGYYGGGNYGDELLLEVLANLLKKKGIAHVTVTYQTPETYERFHHEFGYPRLLMSNKKQLLQAIFKNKNVLIGGGGLWGLDMNANVFLLSCLLFASRFLFGKKVFLLGVGYYNSTTRLGRVGAWFAGKAATHIIARDTETLHNFQRITKTVSQDTDMAWRIPELDLRAYKPEVAALSKTLKVRGPTLFVTLRRFRAHQQNTYADLIEKFLSNNPERTVIVSLMEPRDVDPDGFKRIEQWKAAYPNVQVADFSYNPLALFLFFQEYHDQLALIGPQFHIIITAHLADVPFLPIAYDNKVTQLLEYVGEQPISINQLSIEQLQKFSDKFFKNRR